MLSYMPELVGFQSMVILDPNGMTFDAVGAFGLAFQLISNSGSSYCGAASKVISPHRWLESDLNFRLDFQTGLLPKMGNGQEDQKIAILFPLCNENVLRQVDYKQAPKHRLVLRNKWSLTFFHKDLLQKLSTDPPKLQNSDYMN